MRLLGAESVKKDLKIKDVTPSYEPVNDLLQSIEVSEDQLKHHPTQGILRNLMDLYQRAIESFSSQNNDRFQLYVKKLQALLQNPEYQALLQTEFDIHTDEKQQHISFTN